MIKDSIYKGFGYIDENEQIITVADCQNFLCLKKNTYHTTKIIKSYLRKNGDGNVVSI